jgi:serine/threonine protein kinase
MRSTACSTGERKPRLDVAAPQSQARRFDTSRVAWTAERNGPPMVIGPGSRLDHYELVLLLGAGGMGEVWLAKELRLERKVALKLLPAELTRDPARVSRFEQEARAASALNHPSVCHIYTLGETGKGQHYIAMEYVEGETLRKRLTTSRLSIRESLDLAIHIASALSAVHAADIVYDYVRGQSRP